MELVKTGQKKLGQIWLDRTEIPGRKQKHFPMDRARYSFNECDLLWTARFMVGEAGSRRLGQHAAIVHAMFNDFILARYPKGLTDTFSGKLRSYSTPLQNPLTNKKLAWRHYKKHGAKFEITHRPPQFYPKHWKPSGKEVPMGNTQRHIKIQSMEWLEIDARIRDAALKALNGVLANPGIGNATKFINTTMLWKRTHETKALPTFEQWKKYTSKKKGANRNWTWVGYQPDRLQQYKSNAFYIEDRFADIPTSAIGFDRGDF